MKEFIGVQTQRLKQEEINYLVQEVKDNLEKLNIPCVKSELLINNETFTEVVFSISGLDYISRDRDKSTISKVDTLKLIAYKYEGYSNKEKLEIARKNNTILKDIDSTGFNINFYCNLRLRQYRHKYFFPHTKDNMSSIQLSLDNKGLWQQFYSYMTNIKAIKGR